MYPVFILSLLYYCTYMLTASFMWIENDPKYDYIVGISANDHPICPGVIVTMKTIITSANPLESYWKNKSSVKVHTVYQRYNESETPIIHSIHGNQGYRKENWVQVGFDQSHTTVHDIILIELTDYIFLTHHRGPRCAELPFVNTVFYAALPTTGWMVAGFGYTDNEHVQNNSYLEVTNLAGSLVDCDEWMPREWGLFICISNHDNLFSIPSGGPLLLDNPRAVVFGLGSFILKKGNESILVFTALKRYRFGLSGYAPNITEDEDNI